MTSKLVTTKTGKKILRVTHEVVEYRRHFRGPSTSRRRLRVDSPSEALLASLGTRAKIDWAFMARVTGTGEVSDERIATLQQTLKTDGDIFEQPDGAWITRDEYLSGDVVSKLADATAAAEDEPERYRGNVEALTKVQPIPKTADEIQIALGVHWVDPTDFSRFVDESVGRTGTEMRLDGSEQYVRWTTDYPSHVVAAGCRHPLAVRYGESNEKTYGFTDLLDDALNLKTPDLGYYVTDPVSRMVFIRQSRRRSPPARTLRNCGALDAVGVPSRCAHADRGYLQYPVPHGETDLRRQSSRELSASKGRPWAESGRPADGGVAGSLDSRSIRTNCGYLATSSRRATRCSRTGRRREDVRDDRGGDGNEAHRSCTKAHDHGADVPAGPMAQGHCRRVPDGQVARVR